MGQWEMRWYGMGWDGIWVVGNTKMRWGGMDSYEMGCPDGMTGRVAN